MRNRHVVALAYPGLCLFEFGIAAELFGLPRPELDVAWYEYQVVGVDAGETAVFGGATIQAQPDEAAIRSAGTIVVPGWPRHVDPPPELVDALVAAHEAGARLLSICSGAFLLAATGLLDGAEATTHWRYADELARRFPAISVRPNVLFVDNGSLLTSAGSAAGIDLGLHLIRRDHGAAVAATVARRLVVAPVRDGGQAQYVGDLDEPPSPVDHRLAITVDWALEHLASPLTVERLAREAAMSPRSFARTFRAAMGVAPMAWLQGERVRQAQRLLETTDRSIDRIAADSGFGTAETMRHHFRRRLHVSPSTYRTNFAARSDDRVEPPTIPATDAAGLAPAGRSRPMR